MKDLATFASIGNYCKSFEREKVLRKLRMTDGRGYFNSNATTFSTWWVWGNISTGCTRVTL